jgi:thiamine biosynthesis lipoprotein
MPEVNWQGLPAEDGGVNIEHARGLANVRRFSHAAMATIFEVHVVHDDERYVAHASRAVFDLVDELERELSRFQPTSDITRINHLAAGEATRVSPSTLECLLIARHMFDLTGGAFDAAIGTGLETLELDAEDLSVRATRAGVQIDLGGIGKGYAVDRMAEVLEEWGLARALVHGGFSSLLALDPPADRDGWSLTLSDPLASSRVLARVAPRQTALSASGLRKGDHIIDPRTGAPVRGRRAAWAALPRPAAAAADGSDAKGPRLAAAAVADALTTAFMVLSFDEIRSLCDQSPGLEAWVLPDAGREEIPRVDLLHFGGPFP